MFLNAKTQGAQNFLLAIDGMLIGRIVEAFIGTKEDGGFIVQLEPGDDADADPKTVRREGRVDVLGMVGDPRWMIGQRLDSVRALLQLRPLADELEGTVSDDERKQLYMAAILEAKAREVRDGGITVTNLNMNKEHENFEKSDNKWDIIPTGKLSLEVEYTCGSLVESYEAFKTKWAKENPDLVAEHVRRQVEGAENTDLTKG